MLAVLAQPKPRTEGIETPHNFRHAYATQRVSEDMASAWLLANNGRKITSKQYAADFHKYKHVMRDGKPVMVENNAGKVVKLKEPVGIFALAADSIDDDINAALGSYINPQSKQLRAVRAQVTLGKDEQWDDKGFKIVKKASRSEKPAVLSQISRALKRMLAEQEKKKLKAKKKK